MVTSSEFIYFASHDRERSFLNLPWNNYMIRVPNFQKDGPDLPRRNGGNNLNGS